VDDGGTYKASREQRALFESWIDFVGDVKQLTEGTRRVVVFNGDLGELDTKRRSHQLVSPNKAVILRLVIDALTPMIDIADDVIITRGTLAHIGKSAWLEEATASDLDNIIPSEKANSWWHFRGVIGGVKFDIAHHGRMGSARRTYKNAANQLVHDTLIDYADMKEEPPDVIIRSHQHRRSDSGGNFETFGMFTPAWQLITEFGYRIGAENRISDIGGDVFICGGGQYQRHRFDYKPKKGRRVWALKI